MRTDRRRVVMVHETVVGRLQWEKVGEGHSRLVQQVLLPLSLFALWIVWVPPPRQVGSSMKPLNGFLVLLGRNPSSLKWTYPHTSSLIFHPASFFTHPHYTANLVNHSPIRASVGSLRSLPLSFLLPPPGVYVRGSLHLESCFSHLFAKLNPCSFFQS